jgi:hypothetical protein
MREAPIVRREPAIAVRCYADLSLLPGLTAFAPECKDGCIFVAACSVPPITFRLTWSWFWARE